MRKRAPSKALRFQVLERDNYKCVYCGASADETEIEIDHITPFSKGGETVLDNLVTSCKECNRGKKSGILINEDIVKKSAQYRAQKAGIRAIPEKSYTINKHDPSWASKDEIIKSLKEYIDWLEGQLTVKDQQISGLLELICLMDNSIQLLMDKAYSTKIGSFDELYDEYFGAGTKTA